MPGLGLPAQVRHRRRVARERRARRCAAGAALLVYPGGDHEVHRPSWERHKVDFDGRKGFVRLALEHDVPIVPGRRRSAARRPRCSSRRGERLARLLRLDRLFRLKVLPISLALPWGLNVGDMLGHVPLPAKITIEVLPPIDLRDEFGADPDVDEVYDHVIAPDAGDPRRARRRAALPGDRMRVGAQIEVAAPARARLGVRHRPGAHLHFMSGVTRWEVVSASPTAASARATGC